MKHPSLIRNVLVVLVSLLGTLAVSEIGTRLLQPKRWRAAYVPDPDLGYRLQPSQRGEVADAHGEYRNWFEVNSDGAPDLQRTRPKSEGVYRIAFVGDSMIAAEQVPREKRFPAVVESFLSQSLKEMGGGDASVVEVLNFGTPGYGTAQEWIDYRTRVKHYKPDLVVVGFLPGNDIRNNSYALEVEGAGRDPVLPFFEPLDGRLVQMQVDFFAEAQAKYHSKQRDESFFRRLRLVEIARSAARRLRRSGPTLEKPHSNLELEIARELFEVDRQEADPRWKAAWKTTALLFEAFRRDVAADRAAFHVAVLTGPCAIEPTCRSVLRQGQGDRTFEWTLPHQMAQQMLSRAGFDFTRLLDPLQERVRSGYGPVHFPGDGHYTELGHELVGLHLGAKLLPYLTSRDGAHARTHPESAR